MPAVIRSTPRNRKTSPTFTWHWMNTSKKPNVSFSTPQITKTRPTIPWRLVRTSTIATSRTPQMRKISTSSLPWQPMPTSTSTSVPIINTTGKSTPARSNADVNVEISNRLGDAADVDDDDE